ncbi:excinuclease ABC subunit UvrB [Candidatus Haliotispira prima]|uniref:UvrABC system protein B n=1 Tax=Candidatus Haliotispira prima TaxID=3034016 RepID=A0ABY8MHV9_9SPIO|nr:excinuclease ABC subunit UvrB [Candidatus Haliotispira prima]
MKKFEVVAPYQPAGDQPQAIEALVQSVESGNTFQTLLGVTGSGKTYTVAKTIERVQRPTLVLSHNKTLAAQLYREFTDFFPHNAVGYFISYYDYFQPEAYVPSRDLYIEKEIDINQEIERLRLAATMALMERRDVIIVASVSCIYGLGNPSDFKEMRIRLELHSQINMESLLRNLVDLQYERQRDLLDRGQFRRRGDTLDIFPAYMEEYYRLEFEWDELVSIRRMDPIDHSTQENLEELTIYPATHFAVPPERLKTAIQLVGEELETRLAQLQAEGKILEAQRLKTRTIYDLEMLEEMGVCKGIENYSRHLTGHRQGEPPDVLLDYFPEDFLLVVDESHVTLGQVRAMYNGDQARKRNLVDYGFRLPSALDNRPLKYDEFWRRCKQTVFISATPGEEELRNSAAVVEQLVRPTGLLDPEIDVRPGEGQIEDLYSEIQLRVKRKERTLVTTLTKKMAEHLSDYLSNMGVKCRWLHSELDAIERVEIIGSLRSGIFDVLIGVNLLREGLDMPEVSLVAILDADKIGFLRSATSLIQISGRAARNAAGAVIMYADRYSDAMNTCIRETKRRRQMQQEYNEQHGITPTTIRKNIQVILERHLKEKTEGVNENVQIMRKNTNLLNSGQRNKLIRTLEREMLEKAKNLEFEEAVILRDEIEKLKSSDIYT